MTEPTWIIVINWNGAHLLPACLDSLLAQTIPSHVVVVDNGSSDDSRSVLLRYPSIETIQLPKNLGFAAANNLALRRALTSNAPCIALVNNDVRLASNWLEGLLEAARLYPTDGLFGGLLLFDDGSGLVNSTGLEFDWMGRAKDRDFGKPLKAMQREDGPVAGVSGGAVLLRAAALRKVGLFDPNYFAYYEDVDLSLRAAEFGVGSRYVSAARAYHGYGKTIGVGSPRQRYLLARNHLRALATHYPLLRACSLVSVLLFFRAFVQAPLALLRGNQPLASAYWKSALHGAGAAYEVAKRRLQHASIIPPGAEINF